MVEGATDPIWKSRLRQKASTAKGARVQKILKQLEVSQWWDPEYMVARQFKQLSQLLVHAQRTIAHYAETHGHVNPKDVKSLMAGHWLELPVLKRDTVNRLGEDLLSRDIPKSHGGGLYPIYTSGTTGKPVRVVRTSFALDYWAAFAIRDHIWHNRNIKGKLAAIRLSEKDYAIYPDGKHHVNWGSNKGLFKSGPGVSLNVNTPIADMAEWITRTEPDHLLSLPNIIIRLAAHCIENGILFPFLQEIAVIGEMCGDHLRQQCLEAWNAPVHDSYSSREVGYMALQCPVHDHYHVQSEGSAGQ